MRRVIPDSQLVATPSEGFSATHVAWTKSANAGAVIAIRHPEYPAADFLGTPKRPSAIPWLPGKAEDRLPAVPGLQLNIIYVPGGKSGCL